MKILLITTHLNYGGIASYTVSLAKGLFKRGHEVFVASSGGDFAKKLELKGITHLCLPIFTKSELNPKVLISSIQLFRFVKKKSIDIIHAQTRVTQVAACLISKASTVPYITTCHGFFRPRLGRRCFGAWGDKTVAISEAVREHLVNDFKVKKSNVELIYNGIELEEFKDYSQEEKVRVKERLNLKDGPVVGIVARLSPVKGHIYLIEAMKEVINQIPNALLLIIGNGSIKDELVRLAENLGIKENTYFSDPVLNTAEFLSIMDVFALPSIQEGLGLSIMEALAMKKAVVASDVGGIYTIVKDNITGLLVPSRDSKAMAKVIVTLLSDKTLCNRLGNDGRKLIEEKFSLDSMIEKIEKLYSDVIKGNKTNED